VEITMAEANAAVAAMKDQPEEVNIKFPGRRVSPF
jgi:hypothetical protein